MAVDSSEPSFRKDIYPEYKATRKERPPDLEPQAKRVVEIAHAFGIPCLEVPRMEADDVIATVVDRARAEGLTVVIASADKDMLQLIQPGVVMLDSMRVGDVTVYNVEALVLPAHMTYVLLGNSFLTRFQMRRENDVMTLTKRQ